LWRYRVGQYRLLTQIQDQTLTILMVTITHRKDAY
jgi:mRNA interferase RelE/StbE